MKKICQRTREKPQDSLADQFVSASIQYATSALGSNFPLCGVDGGSS